MKTVTVKCTFIEEVLGSMPTNENLYSDYIASKAPSKEKAEEELEGLEDMEMPEGLTTAFYKLPDGTPCLLDYHIKGFFKDACQMLRRCAKEGYEGAKACGKVSAYKKEIDGCLFVEPRYIPFDMHGMKLDVCERSLRASTPQGERNALAASESVPEGSTLTFKITLLKPSLLDMCKECLDYGVFRGMGQWRNSGKGRFTYEILEETD